jgi:DHA2 family multidrug resistance protein
MVDATADIGSTEVKLGAKQFIAYGGIVLGAFLGILDIQIVASSIGPLSAALSATIEEVAWIQSAYLIAEVIIIPLTAWLTVSLSTRYLFVSAVIGFVCMSIACALAWDLPSMVFFRVLQGLCGGVMIPTMMSSIYVLFPPSRHAFALAVSGFVVIFSTISGPVFGGWITETLSWEWLFLINVPLGAIVAVTVYFTADFDKPDFARLKEVDTWGILLIAVFLGSMEFVLKEGTKHDWFESALIARLAVVAVASFVLFIFRELMARHPVVDIRLFKNSNFALGCGLSFGLGFIQFGPTYLLPASLSAIQGYNSFQIGTVMIVMGVFSAISAALAASLERRVDLRLMMGAGFTLIATGLWVDGWHTNQFGFNELFLGQALRGLGMMFTFLPAATLALGTLRADQVPNGSGFFNLMRNLGGAVGLAGITWLIQVRQDLHYHRIAESVTEGRLAYDTIASAAAPAMEFDRVLPDMQHTQEALIETAHLLASKEALVMTYNDVWLVLAAILGAGLLLLPFVKKVSADDAQKGGH